MTPCAAGHCEPHGQIRYAITAEPTVVKHFLAVSWSLSQLLFLHDPRDTVTATRLSSTRSDFIASEQLSKVV